MSEERAPVVMRQPPAGRAGLEPRNRSESGEGPSPPSQRSRWRGRACGGSPWSRHSGPRRFQTRLGEGRGARAGLQPPATRPRRSPTTPRPIEKMRMLHAPGPEMHWPSFPGGRARHAVKRFKSEAPQRDRGGAVGRVLRTREPGARRPGARRTIRPHDTRRNRCCGAPRPRRRRGCCSPWRACL